MSFARSFPCGNEARRVRALAKRSAGAIFPASNTVSKHTIASLLRLRRCTSAEAFRRWYTSSGMLLSVSVVGTVTSKSHHFG